MHIIGRDLTSVKSKILSWTSTSTKSGAHNRNNSAPDSSGAGRATLGSQRVPWARALMQLQGHQAAITISAQALTTRA